MTQTQIKRLFFSIGIISCLSIAVIAYAQDEASISVDPSEETISSQAGEQQTTTLKISNNTENVQDITIAFHEFTVDENGVPSTPEQTDDPDPATWFAADITEASLAVAEKQDITITIDVPSDASEQGYYVMAIIGSPAADDQENSDEIPPEAQALYYLVVGEPQPSVSIAQIIPTDESVTVVVQNSSAVHTQISGKLDILLDSEILETYTVEPITVFPGQSRNINLAIDTIEGSGHIARASLVYGSDNTIITAERAFDPTDDTTDSASTAASETELSNQDILIYALLVIGAVLIMLGIILTIKKQ